MSFSSRIHGTWPEGLSVSLAIRNAPHGSFQTEKAPKEALGYSLRQLRPILAHRSFSYRTIRLPAGAAALFVAFFQLPAAKAREAAGPMLTFSLPGHAHKRTHRPERASRALPHQLPTRSLHRFPEFFRHFISSVRKPRRGLGQGSPETLFSSLWLRGPQGT